jgi:hypothetical protein
MVTELHTTAAQTTSREMGDVIFSRFPCLPALHVLRVYHKIDGKMLMDSEKRIAQVSIGHKNSLAPRRFLLGSHDGNGKTNG